MKWVFATNEASLIGPKYKRLINCAVNSCLANTDLEPTFLYDGSPDVVFVKELADRGVAIIHTRVTNYDIFRNRLVCGFLESLTNTMRRMISRSVEAVCLRGYDHFEFNNYDPVSWVRTATGAFLRAELPGLYAKGVIEDDQVLYTDCDVMFLRNIEGLETSAPPLFAVGPESRKNDGAHFNTGVMLMNLKGLAAEHDVFQEFIASRKGDFATFDQGAYLEFYKGRNSPLSVEYNWKPYWGRNDSARIIHFHGPKPHDMEICSKKKGPPVCNELAHTDWDSYVYYAEMARRYTSSS